jgi:hypothetical protein
VSIGKTIVMGVFEKKYQQWDIFRGFGKTVSHKNRNRLKKPRALVPAFDFSRGIPACSKLANAASRR